MGTDLVEVDRISDLLGQYPQRFLERCFRPGDVARRYPVEPGSAGIQAESWAAKEAFLKALGSDLRLIPYRDIELIRDSGGALGLNLYGVAGKEGRKAGIGSIHVSISRTRTAAVALVVLGS